MLKKLSIISILFICTSTFATEKTPIFSSPKTPILVSRKDAEFVITLPSNATTGFSWSAKKFNKQYLSLVFHKFVAPQNKKLMGEPGYEAWCFRVKKAAPEKMQIIMEYARPWTSVGATTQTFTIKTVD